MAEKKTSPLDRVLSALKPADLKTVSRDTLANLQDMIGSALATRDDEDADNMPLSQMSNDRFDKFSRRIMEAKGEA